MSRGVRRAQLAAAGLMFVFGLYNLLRPGADTVPSHFTDLATSLLGHLAFSLLGSFAAYLGGPLVQVAFPLALATYLVTLKRPFLASLALFWAAHSLVGVSLYVRDARALSFTLYNGGEHIWHRLLYELGLLPYDQVLGSLLQLSGVLTLFAACGLALLANYPSSTPTQRPRRF